MLYVLQVLTRIAASNTSPIRVNDRKRPLKQVEKFNMTLFY